MNRFCHLSAFRHSRRPAARPGHPAGHPARPAARPAHPAGRLTSPDARRTLPFGARALFLALLGLLPVMMVPASGPFIAAEPERPYYFYRGLSHGSERLVSPLRTIVNGGLGILDMDNRSNRFADIHWENGWGNLWKNLAHPFRSIEEQGWGEFLKKEVVPFSVERGNSQYWPNYMNHLLGGGFSYRLMREWYRRHGFRHETAWAVGTMMIDHLLNEAVEMDDTRGWRSDPVADVYLFNVAGMLLYSSDTVARFFGRTLNMADWSYLSFYDPGRGTIENVSQKYMIRVRLGGTTPWHLFYHWGNSGELGLSRHVGDGRHVSLGFGLVATDIVEVDDFSETVNLAETIGLFYDREGSLLASLLYARDKRTHWRLNLYPGLLRLGPCQPGLAAIMRRGGDVSLGLTIGSVPLLPTGVGPRVRRGP